MPPLRRSARSPIQMWRPLRSAARLLSSALLLSACAGTVDASSADANGLDRAVPPDSAAMDGASMPDVTTDRGPRDASIDRAEGPVGGFDWCRCEPGERCCAITGQCSSAEDFRARCPSGNLDAGSDTACLDNTDCPAGAFCQIVGCSNAGTCTGAENCDRFRGSACACNGTTVDGALACRTAIALVSLGACGTRAEPIADAGTVFPTICGSRDELCPTGQRCCPVLGVCVDADCGEACCRRPTPGTEGPCRAQRDCLPASYCRTQGCGAAGDCVRRGSPLMCPPVLAPVCGCDGQTYLTECLARTSGVNVARPGACAP